MGFLAVEAVLKHSQSTGAARAALLVIAHRMKDNYSFPGRDTIARDAGISTASVSRSIKMLEEAGELVIYHQADQQAARGHISSNGYALPEQWYSVGKD